MEPRSEPKRGNKKAACLVVHVMFLTMLTACWAILRGMMAQSKCSATCSTWGLDRIQTA